MDRSKSDETSAIEKEDIIRVLRIVEYIGPRSKIEQQVLNSIHGERSFGNYAGITIRAATLGEFPEIMERGKG